MNPTDLFLHPSTIESAQRHAREAIDRTAKLEVDAEQIAARTTAVNEANHLTEHLAKLLVGR